MKTMIALALGALVLSGCTKTVAEMSYSERKALAGEIVQRCYAQGVKTGTPEMQACMQAETQREVATRDRRARVEDARRASGTVCNKVGYTVICN